MDKTQLNKAYFEAGDWLKTRYQGVLLLKYTTDLWQYQSLLAEVDPDLIIETGTLKGGSAAFFKDNSRAKVITIDILDQVSKKRSDITYIFRDSLKVDIDIDHYKRVMVVLDSDHSRTHVLAELKKFAPLVSKGCYLVVEDTFISRYLDNQDPNNDYSNGSSWEAVQEWDSSGFEQQPDMFTLSMNPGGWFKRV